LVLGAGFGGLELSTRLSEQLGDEVEVILIDHADSSVFGFSKLDVMFGRTTADAVRHPYADLVKPDVRFVNTATRSIDPLHRAVETDTGRLEGDVLVVALGADLDDVPEGRAARWPVRRGVKSAHRRQGRVGHQPHAPLVRP
jgi:sulfide:quinone oxidoreductase